MTRISYARRECLANASRYSVPGYMSHVEHYVVNLFPHCNFALTDSINCFSEMAIIRASLQSGAQQCARLTRPAQARCMGSLTQSHAQSISPLLPHLPKSSKWKRTDAVPLTKDNYLDLLHGNTPLIKESNFLSAEQCKPYEALMSRQLTPYKHNTGPLLTKYGVAQFEYQAQAADDFLKRTNGEHNVSNALRPKLIIEREIPVLCGRGPIS